jgi:hypothetical protein
MHQITSALLQTFHVGDTLLVDIPSFERFEATVVRLSPAHEALWVQSGSAFRRLLDPERDFVGKVSCKHSLAKRISAN